MPDYMYLMVSRLSPEQHAVLVRAQELAQSQGINIYLAGGAIRDLLSGAPIRDLDFILEGNPAFIVREFEKDGAELVAENTRLRQFELRLQDGVSSSIAQARDEVYALPGARPELRWSTIMEDLRRRDFSINSIAISLNPASRGLLLDPTNGLADIERREVRALSIHCFTNQPVRLLRILRYAARLDFKFESRTQEWFDLAIERRLDQSIAPGEAGGELRQLGVESHPGGVLKAWEARGLLASIHPHLTKRRPDYEGLARLARAADSMFGAGLHPQLFAPVAWYVLRRLTPRERTLALQRLEWRARELAAVAKLEAAGKSAFRALKRRQTEAARDAYDFIDKLPADVLAFVQAEFPNPRVSSKVRNYLHKWRPLRLSLPAAELESLGIPRGPQFDRILDRLFELQLRGRGKLPQDRTRLLRQLAGIKPEPKKPEKKSAKPAGGGKAATAVRNPPPADGARAKSRKLAAKPEATQRSAEPGSGPGVTGGGTHRQKPASAGNQPAPAAAVR